MLAILGVKVDNLNKKNLLEKIDDFLIDKKSHYIVTANPEIVLKTQEDEEYFFILNSSDITIADGIGLKFAAWAQFHQLARITGADLTPEILKLAEERKLKLGIVNWANGLSSKESIEKFLKISYPNLNSEIVDIKNREEINAPNLECDIMLATLGAPYQEKFIYHNLKKIKNLKLAIGVGGSFDFLTGAIQRAPKLIRMIGLEWIWRLIQQPKKRAKRIYNAYFVFVAKFLRWRFWNRFCYRPNVVCLLIKEENGKRKALIVARRHPANHWQIPQGGTDGESLEVAGAREMCEETGTDKFEMIGVFPNFYKYRFGEKTSKFLVKARQIEGYKGQKQGLFVARFTGQDADIRINFWEHTDWRWVDLEDLPKEVNETRSLAAEKILRVIGEL